MKIAIVSLNQVWENKKANLILCEDYIKKASLKGVDLIIFPEMTLTGFSTNINAIAEDNSDSISSFKTLAKTYNIAILFGVTIKNGDKALNKSFFVNKDGEILGEYAKIHPFSFAGEDKYFNAGNELSIVKFHNFNIGLSICYDLRFPELYSVLGAKSDIIINIANWPKKRVSHWSTLLKARAIENQVFIVGVNRVGIDGNNLEYEESSNIFDVNGEEIKFDRYKDMKIYTLKKDNLENFKNSFNTVNDRRVELYKRLLDA